MLLLGLTRPALFERRPSWRSPAADAQLIKLPALSRAQADELVADLLQLLRPLPAGLSELITGRADGNPFYIEELVNMLIDQKVIVTQADAWQYQFERMQSLTVPSNLVGVLQARLDTLPPAERHTSQLAAVVGFQFWDECLRELGALLPASLQGLVERELVLGQPDSSLGGMHEYVFKHHILQQVAYTTVLKQTKRDIHAKVADWLVSLPGEPPLDLVAEHYERGGVVELALDFWERAAGAAASRYANRQALMHAERALALIPTGDLARRYALTDLRCRVMQLQSDRDQLKLELDSLQGLAEALAQASTLSEALARRARFCFDGGDIEAALSYARQSVAHAPPTDPACGALAHALVAQCLLRLGELRQADSESAEALRLAQVAGDHGTEGMILNDIGMRADIAGDPAAAIAYYEQALACHRRVGNRNNEGGTLTNLAYAALVLGDYAAAGSQFAEARQLFASIGSSQNEGITLINLGIARLNQGHAADALSYAQQALQMLQTTGFRWAAGAALRLSGQAALALEDTAAAATHLQASRDLFETIGMPHLALEAVAGLAQVALACGDKSTALALTQALVAQQALGVNLDGCEEPMRVHLICYTCLCAGADPRAQAVLDAAYRSLMERAARISDPARRQSYLHDAPHHRDIAQAWNKRR